MEFPATGGFIGVYSDENIDAMRGEAFHIVLIDEAARVREDSAAEVVLPTLADYGGTMFAFSTPRGRNWFYEGWERGRVAAETGSDDAVRSWRAPTTANPSPMIRRAAMLARSRIAERIYLQEWEAAFISDALSVWLPEWFERRNRWTPSPARDYQVAGRYVSWDTALQDKDDSAYSAMVVGELLQSYHLHVRSAWRDKLAFPALVDEIVARATEWNYDGKLRGVLIEDKASGTSALQTLRARGPEWLRPLLIGFMPRESKPVRGEQAAVWGKAGSIWLPQPGPEYHWLHDFERELYRFPHAEFLDQGDALHQLVLFLENYICLARPVDQAGESVHGLDWVAGDPTVAVA
jgi:predicted phage terminase large subunit-like protein